MHQAPRRRYVRPSMLLVTGAQNELGVAIVLAILWLWLAPDGGGGDPGNNQGAPP